jgi:hypothetical protein
MADVEFGTSDVSSLLAAMEEEDNSGSFESKTWNPKQDGTTKIRFLPQLKTFGEKNFYRKHKIHYINGRPYFCLNQTLKDKDGNIHEAETCPLCKKASAIYNVSSRGTPEWDLAGSIRAKERFITRIIVRGNKEKDGTDIEYKPQFYEFGTKIRDMIKSALESGEYGNPLDLKAGRDFSLAKHGQKRNTSYDGSMFSVNQTPIFTDSTKLKALLAELPKMDYSQLVEFETPEELTKVLNEYLSEEDTSVSSSTVKSEPVENEKISDDAVFGATPSTEENPGEEEDIDALLNSI